MSIKNRYIVFPGFTKDDVTIIEKHANRGTIDQQSIGSRRRLFSMDRSNG